MSPWLHLPSYFGVTRLFDPQPTDGKTVSPFVSPIGKRLWMLTCEKSLLANCLELPGGGAGGLWAGKRSKLTYDESFLCGDSRFQFAKHVFCPIGFGSKASGLACHLHLQVSSHMSLTSSSKIPF